MFYNRIIKRIADIVLSLFALVMLSPFLIIIGLLIKVDSYGPIFFYQKRLGKNERLFIMYKFRTMTHDDHAMNLQVFSGDNRITRVGAVLRRLKLDELPQLINVIKGDMSVIGPRPCLPSIKEKFGKYANERFKVRPGLTSLAAIKGSIYLTWEEKGYFDVYYVNNLSFLLDIKIVLQTIRVLIVGERRLFKGK